MLLRSDHGQFVAARPNNQARHQTDRGLAAREDQDSVDRDLGHQDLVDQEDQDLVVREDRAVGPEGSWQICLVWVRRGFR